MFFFICDVIGRLLGPKDSTTVPQQDQHNSMKEEALEIVSFILLGIYVGNREHIIIPYAYIKILKFYKTRNSGLAT